MVASVPLQARLSRNMGLAVDSNADTPLVIATPPTKLTALISVLAQLSLNWLNQALVNNLIFSSQGYIEKTKASGVKWNHTQVIRSCQFSGYYPSWKNFITSNSPIQSKFFHQVKNSSCAIV